jgi:PTS system nitrogen regulatory IIA component
MNIIAGLLLPEDVLLDLDISSKSQLFDDIGRHMERQHGLPQDLVAMGLARREEVGSTGLGEGVAIPHARVANLDRIQVAYLRLHRPLPFDAADGKPVSDILVLLVPKQAAEEHLTVLADATRMLSVPRFRAQLHLCKKPLEVTQLVATWSPLAK